MTPTPNSRPTTPEPRTGVAYAAFLTAQDSLADQGRRTPCDRRNAWLSDKPALRAEAAVRCGRCPLLAECRQAAREFRPSFGVWGGTDYGKVGAR